jgi:hypothetical protein
LVIVEHLEAFPESPPADHPSAATRCEALIHILAEYGAAFRDKHTTCEDGFAQYHKKGVEAQTALRKTLKQCAAKQNVLNNGALEMQHCNGTKTTVTQDGTTGKITVDHGPKETKAEVPKIMLPKMPDRQDTLKSLLDTSPYIFAGTVEEIGESPRYWSNFFLSYQRVRYSAIEFIKGYIPGPYLDIFHLVLEHSAAARRNTPGLCHDVFSPGRRLLVFVEPGIDPDCISAFRMVADYPNHVVCIKEHNRGDNPDCLPDK